MHTQSEIRIQDEGAKFGTEIDGERVPSGSSALLQNDEHSFRLGKTAHIFRYDLLASLEQVTEAETASNGSR